VDRVVAARRVNPYPGLKRFVGKNQWRVAVRRPLDGGDVPTVSVDCLTDNQATADPHGPRDTDRSGVANDGGAPNACGLVEQVDAPSKRGSSIVVPARGGHAVCTQVEVTYHRRLHARGLTCLCRCAALVGKEDFRNLSLE
jgi:hypothetical protein